VRKLFLIIPLMLSCSPKSDYLSPQPHIVREKHSDKPGDLNMSIGAAVDILFVVDDSGSMGTHQQNLSDNIDRFVSHLRAFQILDYHIGVITTNEDVAPNFKKENLVASVAYKGELVDKDFITRDTVDGEAILKRRLLVGTDGNSTESVFAPVRLALSEPNLSNANKGFYRPEAYLAVFVITDTEDQSKVDTPISFFNFLSDLKDLNKVMVYGAISPTGSNCPRDDYGDRLEQFFKLIHASYFSLCDADFGDRLAGAAMSLIRKVGATIKLTRHPVPSTIHVQYGSQVIPNDFRKGWTFDPTTNSIYLGPDLVLDPNQPAGSKLTIEFDIAEVKANN
jgi:hypothetical protein